MKQFIKIRSFSGKKNKKFLMMSAQSKPLSNSDQSSFDFVKESLKGDKTSGINFDRVQYDYSSSQDVIIEYLLYNVKIKK